MNAFMYMFQCFIVVWLTLVSLFDGVYCDGIGELGVKEIIIGIFETGIIIGSYFLLRQFYPAVKSLVLVLIGMGCLWLILVAVEPFYIKSRSRRMALDFNFLDDYGYSLDSVGKFEIILKCEDDEKKHIRISKNPFREKKMIIVVTDLQNATRQLSLPQNGTFNNDYKSQVPYAQKVLKEWLDNNK